MRSRHPNNLIQRWQMKPHLLNNVVLRPLPISQGIELFQLEYDCTSRTPFQSQSHLLPHAMNHLLSSQPCLEGIKRNASALCSNGPQNCGRTTSVDCYLEFLVPVSPPHSLVSFKRTDHGPSYPPHIVGDNTTHYSIQVVFPNHNSSRISSEADPRVDSTG